MNRTRSRPSEADEATTSPAPVDPITGGAPSELLPDPTPARDDDRALVARLLGGDERAFTALVDAMHSPLLRFVQALLGGPDDAEDVVQETWLAAVANLRQWQGRSSLRTWIYAIAARRAWKEAGRKGRAVPFSVMSSPGDEALDVLSDVDRPPWPTGPGPRTPDSRLHDREVVEALEGALGQLPQAQRAVIILCDIEGLDADSVCNVLGVSRTNRRVLLHRARSRVREILRARFGDLW